MSLGETIYKLRTEKNLSQGDLAEMLEVSRQSVSKWENDSAVPDLAKIVKLSEVFEVSLDELVKGEKTKQAQETLQRIETTPPIPEVKIEFNNVREKTPGRMIAGTILLCMAFLVTLLIALAGGGWGGIIYASPFLVCGILCFVLKKRIGLWCAWSVYFMFDTCLAYLMGFSRTVAFRSTGWTFGRIFVCVMIFALVLLIVATVICFRKEPLPVGNKGRVLLFAPWIAWIVLHVLSFLLGGTLTERYDAEHILPCYSYRLLSMLLSWGRIISVTVGLVMIVRFVRAKRNSQEDTSFR